MMRNEQIKKAFCDVTIVTDITDGFLVSTQCLYPSNGAVSVAIRGRGNSYVISDDGGALGELRSAGLHQTPTDRQIRAIVQNMGLKVENGQIYSPPVSQEAIPYASMIVANAAKTVADWGLDHLRFAVPRNFRQDLTELLQRHFHDNMKDDQPIVGASNKPHKFGHVVYLENEKRLLIDPVVNDSSSINSRLVANLDVKMKKDSKIEQLIVYDDSAKWAAADLNLLQVGAKIIAFSSADGAIQRIAA
jgi:hypothetical protein